MKLYVDTNVFISLIREETSDRRSLFSEALSFFRKAAQQKDEIITSKLSIKEISKICYLNKEATIESVKIIFPEIKIVEINKENEANYYKKGIHYPDSIHASTAKKENCDYLVTFNYKDFEKIKNEINAIEPNYY